VDKLKSRKLWAFVSIVVTATVLLTQQTLTSDQWVEVLKWAGGSFMVGQGVADGFSR